MQNAKRNFSEKSVTIDAAEVTTFTNLSDRWWDKNGEFKVLHAMNPLRLDMVNNLFRNESPKPWYPLFGKRIMDIGCGGGILTEVIFSLQNFFISVAAKSPRSSGPGNRYGFRRH